MSEVFCDYARYYDLLYKDKDYHQEAAYIHGLIQKYKPGAATILDLGCGTGKHDACLMDMGYQITGVDLSETMLIEARKRAVPGRMEFVQGDVRSVDLGKRFDVIVLLFHVMSYQTTDEDVAAALRTAGRHLKEGGILVFDFWNEAGVLKDPPVVRVKRLEDDTVRIVRIAEPVTHADKHVIDVNYEIITMDKKTLRFSELRESHVMRYFLFSELETALKKAGLIVKNAGKWMSDEDLSSAWYGIIIAVRAL